MNCERSSRRDWQRRVAIGLGRALTREEAERVAGAEKHYRAAIRWDATEAIKAVPIETCSGLVALFKAREQPETGP